MPNPFRVNLRKYLASATGYGALRSVVYTYDADSYDYVAHGFVRTRRPMLLTERIAFMGLQAALGIFMWPMFACHDLARMERAARGLDPPERTLVPLMDMFVYAPCTP